MNLRETISEQELRRLYFDEHWTQQELAEYFGCSEVTIRRRMLELGLESRSRGPQLGSKNANPEWTPALAYVVGVIATDGNLSSDKRHLTIRSKDYQLLETVKQCLELKNRIATRRRFLYVYFSLEWGDRAFYDWLQTIGLMRAKSLVLGPLAVPDLYFRDFLRGVIDGDGCIRIYQDQWNTFKSEKYVYARVYVTIASASFPFLEWIQNETRRLCGIHGAMIPHKKRFAHHAQLWELKYAKKESLVLFEWLYYDASLPALERKRLLAIRALEIGNS